MSYAAASRAVLRGPVASWHNCFQMAHMSVLGFLSLISCFAEGLRPQQGGAGSLLVGNLDDWVHLDVIMPDIVSRQPTSPYCEESRAE